MAFRTPAICDLEAGKQAPRPGEFLFLKAFRAGWCGLAWMTLPGWGPVISPSAPVPRASQGQPDLALQI